MHTSPKNKFHKLLFSATLTRDPQHLASLSLRNPLFFSAATDKRYVVPPRLTVKIIIIKLLERSFFFFEEGLYQWKLLVLLYAEREQLYIIIFKGTSCGVQRLGEASGFGAFAAHGPSQTYYLFHCVCGFDAQVFFFFYCYFIFSNYFVLPPEACFCKKKIDCFVCWSCAENSQEWLNIRVLSLRVNALVWSQTFAVAPFPCLIFLFIIIIIFKRGERNRGGGGVVKIKHLKTSINSGEGFFFVNWCRCFAVGCI